MCWCFPLFSPPASKKAGGHRLGQRLVAFLFRKGCGRKVGLRGVGNRDKYFFNGKKSSGIFFKDFCGIYPIFIHSVVI